jgi:histidinol phosphatase-like enzyme (inositol monophosphatase family)
MDMQSKRFTLLNTTAERVSAFVASQFFSKNFTVSIKNDGSELTTVDVEAENLAKKLILEAFPEDGFLGEEDGEIKGTSEFRWVVDPIDGTASFARGVPLFGTLIGLEHKGEAIAGAAHLPVMGEVISAVLFGGVEYQGKNSAAVSTTDSLDESMVCTTSYDYYKQTDSELLYSNLLSSGCSLRGWSDCYAYMLLCTGRIDGVVEPLLKPWDIIPWLPIIKETGGKYSPIAKGGIASNAIVHDALYHALSCTV